MLLSRCQCQNRGRRQDRSLARWSGASKIDVPYLNLVLWMNCFELCGRRVKYTRPNSTKCLISNVSNPMCLFLCNAYRNCDNDVVAHRLHSRLLRPVIPDQVRCRPDRLFAEAFDDEFIAAPHVPVTICFSFLAFVLVLIGEYELGKIPEKLALVFANLAYDKSRAVFVRDRADAREYSADCCGFILICFVHVTISCCSFLCNSTHILYREEISGQSCLGIKPYARQASREQQLWLVWSFADRDSRTSLAA